jgi:monoterpene epsilon-lactone hydrolase
MSVPNAAEIFHALTAADANVMKALRAELGYGKGVVERVVFDAMMDQTPGAPDMVYEPGVVGGVNGVWCRPEDAIADVTILYIHGGAYIAGNAAAFRHLAGQIAHRVRAAVFVPDYRLAPEHAFPAAVDDVVAVYRGLANTETRAFAVAGDSAGGGLALSLVSILTSPAMRSSAPVPCACVAISPWTDLALTGESLKTRANVDPFLTYAALASAAEKYLAGSDPRDPRASPLYADVGDLPPLHIHTGLDEILLADSQRYAERAAAANVDVALHLWEGMPHVFPSMVGRANASSESLDIIGAFLAERLGAR